MEQVMQPFRRMIFCLNVSDQDEQEQIGSLADKTKIRFASLDVLQTGYQNSRLFTVLK